MTQDHPGGEWLEPRAVGTDVVWMPAAHRCRVQEQQRPGQGGLYRPHKETGFGAEDNGSHRKKGFAKGSNVITFPCQKRSVMRQGGRRLATIPHFLSGHMCPALRWALRTCGHGTRVLPAWNQGSAFRRTVTPRDYPTWPRPLRQVTRASAGPGGTLGGAGLEKDSPTPACCQPAANPRGCRGSGTAPPQPRPFCAAAPTASPRCVHQHLRLWAQCLAPGLSH